MLLTLVNRVFRKGIQDEREEIRKNASLQRNIAVAPRDLKHVLQFDRRKLNYLAALKIAREIEMTSTKEFLSNFDTSFIFWKRYFK